MSEKSVACLLILVMLLMPMTATAAANSAYNKVNIWGIMPSGTVVYRNAQLNRQWGSAPSDLIMRVVAYKGGVALVRNGGKLGYCSLNDFKPLTAGVKLVSSVRTRVYQSPSTKSNYINISKGLSMELVSLKGDCAEVRRGEHVGYVNIGHLQPAQ